MLDFTTPPYEAIAYLLSKKPQIIKDQATLKHNIAQKAFTISGITNIDRLSAFQNSLALAMLKGQSFSEWKKVNASLIEGWEGVDNKRLKKIYAHNLKNAYAQGRKMEMMSRPALNKPRKILEDEEEDDEGEEIEKPKIEDDEGIDDGWYFRFSCVLDSATRPSHRVLHGTILPRRHSFWEKHTPPLDWGCRCRIDIFSLDHLQENGWIPNSTPPVSTINNPFAFSSTHEELEHIISSKLKSHSQNKNAIEALKAMQKELERREECFKMMRKLWDNINLKTPYSICSIPSTLASLLGTQTKEVRIVADTIRRHKVRHPEIDAFDYSLIPYILENIDSLYADPKDERYLIIISKKFDRFYRLALKHIKDKNEVWVSSLAGIDSKKRILGEKRKLERNKALVVVKDRPTP